MQALQGGPFHVAAGEAAVVVAVGQAVSSPRPAWLRMKASADSRWASRELNSCSSPSSVDLRV